MQFRERDRRSSDSSAKNTGVYPRFLRDALPMTFHFLAIIPADRDISAIKGLAMKSTEDKALGALGATKPGHRRVVPHFHWPHCALRTYLDRTFGHHLGHRGTGPWSNHPQCGPVVLLEATLGHPRDGGSAIKGRLAALHNWPAALRHWPLTRNFAPLKSARKSSSSPACC